jgi:hypothetical protein
MNFHSWLHLWRIERDVKIPHLSVTVMTPWAFARLLWFYNRRPFQAWPSEYETSLVLGWRWPFAKTFREKKWANTQAMPMAVYGGPMDEVYLIRAVKELDFFIGAGREHQLADRPEIRHIGPTVKVLLGQGPKCDHPYWIATCPQCARKALRLAVNLKAKYEPVRLIDPHEEPIIGFRRREAEALARLKAAEMLALPAGEGDHAE